MTGPHQVAMSFRQDSEAVRGRRLERETLRRVVGLCRPYKRALVGFLVTVIAAAVVGAIPPLILRSLLDTAVPEKDRTMVAVLAAAAVGLAIASSGLSLVQRWYSAKIGEGLIYDLRVALFDHVQRLPLSFFTRTQTGALMSRLNNDVIGAQQAVTNTLGTVVSNVITLVVTLSFMLALEWKLTILTLVVLPFFIIPARHLGRKLVVATRESMQLNASMNNTVVERFNVAGALVVKLFGSHDSERDNFSGRAGRVRDIGITTAMYSRVLFVALGLRHRGGHGDRLPRRRQPRDQRRDLDRHHRRVRGLRRADLPAAHAAHERPRRRHDRDRVVRAGVRGARLPGADHRAPRRRRPSTSRRAASPSTTCGSATRRRRRRRSPRSRKAWSSPTTTRARGSCAT